MVSLASSVLAWSVAGGLCLTLLALAAVPAAAQGAAEPRRTLAIATWGGAYARSQERAYFAPYRLLKPNLDIKTINAGGDSVAMLREQVKAKKVEWDLVDVTAADAIRLCKEGVALPLWPDYHLQSAPDGTPPTQDFGQTIVAPCFVPEIVYSTTFGYRIDKVKQKPESLCDVFDTTRFPGKRALEKRPINNLEWALVCDGVPAEQIYEVLDSDEGVERALRRLSAIKHEIIWWTGGEEPATLLADGDVVFASAYNGRLFALVTAKNPRVAMLWDRQVFDFDGWIIPKGAPNLDAALSFIRFATDTQRLADQASYIPYGPARRSSTLAVGKHADFGIDMKPHMPTQADNARTTLIYNYDWWAAHRDRVDARFQEWLTE
jgi:putative spermidine/putrescine transport system substrate-binding protein